MSYFPPVLLHEWSERIKHASLIILAIFAVISLVVWYLGIRYRKGKVRFAGFCLLMAGVFLWIGIQTMRGLAEYKTNANFALLTTLLVPIPATVALFTKRNFGKRLAILQLVVVLSVLVGQIVGKYYLLI